MGGSREARIAALAAELKRVRERRAVYNGRRYPQPKRDLCRVAECGDRLLGQAAQTMDKGLLPNALGAQPAGNVSVRGDDCGIVGTNHRLESLWNEIDELKEQRTELTNTINKLQVKTWGIRLLEDKSGRFIVLPKGSTIKNNWAWGDSPALKLE